MKWVVIWLTLTLILAIAFTSAFPESHAQNVLLSVDFTGNSLPSGWFLQGSASFIGSLNAATGVGGIKLVNGASQEGTAYYGSAFTTRNIVIQFSGMYVNSSRKDDGDQMGVGFYSGGPSSTNAGCSNLGTACVNSASPRGYYAAYGFANYELFVGAHNVLLPALLYNGNKVSSGGSLPTSGRNYLFTATTVTPTMISLDALTTTNGFFSQAPSISLTNMLTYTNATGIDNSHSTLYVGGGTSGPSWSNMYVYWLRILTYNPVPEYPMYFLPLVASLTIVAAVMRYRSKV